MYSFFILTTSNVPVATHSSQLRGTVCSVSCSTTVYITSQCVISIENIPFWKRSSERKCLTFIKPKLKLSRNWRTLPIAFEFIRLHLLKHQNRGKYFHFILFSSAILSYKISPHHFAKKIRDCICWSWCMCLKKKI